MNQEANTGLERSRAVLREAAGRLSGGEFSGEGIIILHPPMGRAEPLVINIPEDIFRTVNPSAVPSSMGG